MSPSADELGWFILIGCAVVFAAELALSGYIAKPRRSADL
jgi:hypothetical protein